MRRFCRCLVLFIFFSSWLSIASAQIVSMPDANLRAAVRDVLGLGPNAPITRQALQRLTRLDARDSQIKNLTGLEHATRLESLELRNNQVTDIRLLANLKNLTQLILDNNRVSDIRVLAGMRQLTWLLLGRNPISDFTPLSNLTELRGLALWHNDVKDLTPLASMTKLTNLWLERNQIGNITPLANLTHLKFLDLRDNQIRNVSLLRRLTNLETLWLRGNPIQDTSPLAALTKLRDVDIEIRAAPVARIIPDPNLAAVVRDTLGLAPTAPITRQALQRLTSLNAHSNRVSEITGQKTEIRNISGLEHATRLTELWLTNNQIRDIGPLAGLTQLRTLDLEYTQIRDIGPLVGLTQLRTLNIWGNPINDFRPLARLKQLRALLTDVGQISELQTYVDLTRLTELQLHGAGQQIRDPHLLAGLTQLTVLQITSAQVRDLSFLRNLTRLEKLSLRKNGISDLKPLVGLKQLKKLYIHNNQIRELQPLAGLKNLMELDLAHNQIRDVSPLAGLVNLVDLRLVGNPIQDVSPLSNLLKLDYVDVNIPSPAVSIPDPNLAAAVRKALDLRENAPITRQLIQKLTELDASDSQIKNLTGLEHATRLRLLEVRRNQIRDIRPLTKLKNLKELILEQNAVRDIRPVANMTELRWLLLGGNPISDFTPLANLNQLEGLGLWGGNIGDVTLLANKTKLTHLWVARNNISNIAPLANLTQLKVLELRDNRIRDINPLVGLKKLEALSLSGNPIQDLSPLRTLLKQNPKLELDIRPDAGPKIEGPWVWMIAPTGEKGPKAASSGKDWLAAASGGSVTEQHIATNGARAGDAVGNKVWTSGKIAPTGGNNIAEMVNTIGLGNGGYIEYHVAYGSLALDSPRKQNTKMYVGSDESVKVWLNGVLVHNNPADRGARDYQDTFSVTLKQGRNILLVAVYNGRWHWSGFFGFENDAVYSLTPTSVVHIGAAERPPMYWIDASTGALHRLVGDEVENFLSGFGNAISLAIANNKMYWTEDTNGNIGTVKGADLGGSNVRVLTRLQSVPTSIAVDTANSKLYWTNSRGRIQAMNVNGGTITNLIQNLKEPNTITLDAAASMLYWGGPDSIWRADRNGHNREAFAPNLGELGSIAIAEGTIYSVERPEGEQHYQIRSSTLNGLTPAQTLVRLQSKPLGLAVDTIGGKLYWTTADGKIQRANLNGGNIQEVVTGLRAPGDIVLGIPTRTNPAAPGITALVTHQLPVETRLLANYPNPFNPETWIPYQLATDTDVQILIYDARGSIIRRLGLGHQLAGTYTDRSQAAYWNGRNTLGEPVASGLYFYQLQTDTVSLLRKMLILR